MTFTVIATWVAREGEEEAVEQAIRSLVEPSRAEPGCLSYLPHRLQDHPRSFVLVEQYENEAAYAAHTESDHFRTFALEQGIPHLERRGRLFCESL